MSMLPATAVALDPTVTQIAAASADRLLTADEEQALGRLVQLGDQEARELLALRNLRLVWSIAPRFSCEAMTLEDLYIEGVAGLLRAIDKFEPERGHKFSTYATWWIRQAIGRAAMDHRGLVRLPIHMSERMAKISKATSHLLAQHGRMPTDAELCEAVGIVQQQLDTARSAQRVNSPVSLDASIDTHSGEEGSSLINLLADPNGLDPLEQLEASAEAALARAHVAELLAGLPARQREILELRYGLDGYGTMRTLAQVGERLGITRERARQIEAEAMKTLRRIAGVELATAAD